MTAMDTDDLAVVTGPITLGGLLGGVDLVPGEVVRIEEGEDTDGTVYVYGMESDIRQYIDRSALTPLDEISSRTDIQWGDPKDAVV